mmetsp:Transcript_14097/g.45147  ORF Transcript_14097/g.45147 Transcript_14097/m.45147 type:complete len:561 (-) Transcript_14097:1239-2921(-)
MADELAALMQAYYEAPGSTKSTEMLAEKSASSSCNAAGSQQRAERTLTGVGEACWAHDVVPALGETPLPGGVAPWRSSPAIEVWAGNLKRKIHAALEQACLEQLGEAACKKLALFSSITLRNGDALYERWHFSALAHSKPAATASVLLLPDADGIRGAEPVLVQGLASLGERLAPPSRVQATAAAFSTNARRLIRAPAPAAKDRTFSTGRSIVKVDRRGKKVTVAFKSRSHKINQVHFAKLHELHKRTASRERQQRPFEEDLFSMLERYRSLGGSGFQAAISGSAFEALRRRFGVDCECFASPLNCRYERFCSAFPDTDAAFGSLGSFFAFAPLEGAFEANPPFVESTTVAMAQHMRKCLLHSQKEAKELLFAIVVPVKFREAVIRLIGKEFYRGRVSFTNREHDYSQGAQQRAGEKRQRVASTCDSDVHIVATDAAMASTPFDEAAVQDITSAFAPSDSPDRGDGDDSTRTKRPKPAQDEETKAGRAQVKKVDAAIACGASKAPPSAAKKASAKRVKASPGRGRPIAKGGGTGRDPSPNKNTKRRAKSIQTKSIDRIKS